MADGVAVRAAAGAGIGVARASCAAAGFGDFRASFDGTGLGRGESFDAAKGTFAGFSFFFSFFFFAGSVARIFVGGWTAGRGVTGLVNRGLAGSCLDETGAGRATGRGVALTGAGFEGRAGA